MNKKNLKRMLSITAILTLLVVLNACSSSDDDNGNTIGGYKTTPVEYIEGTFSGYTGKDEATVIVELVNNEQALFILNNKLSGKKITATVYIEGVIMIEGVDPTILSKAGEVPSIAYNHKTKKLIIAGREGGVTMTFSGNKI